MNTSLTQLFREALLSALPPLATRLATPSLPGASAGLAGAALAHHAPCKVAVVVTPSAAEQERVYGDLCALGREGGVVALCFPRQTLAGDAETTGLRLQVVQALRTARPAVDQDTTPTETSACGPLVVVASIQAMVQPVADPDAVMAASVSLRVGMETDFAALVTHLSEAGYERVTDVETTGQFTVRGGILDIWPPAASTPWRAEFFGSTLESLRTFDPATQCSIGKGEEIWLPVCSEAVLPKLRVTELLPSEAALIWLEQDHIQATLQFPPEEWIDPPTWLELVGEVEARSPALQLFCGDPPPAQMPALRFPIAALPGLSEFGAGDAHHPELLMQARKKLLDQFEAQAAVGTTVMMCADTAGTCEVLLRELGPATHLQIHKLALSGGFLLPGLTVVTQSDLYTIRKSSVRHPVPATALRGGRVEHAADLAPGDWVVHVDHGIGRFLGSTELEINGIRSEVFTLEYAEGAKLHVPVSHAHLLSRYVGVAGHKIKLHRLGGRRWTREKVDAERAVADLAASLLETQARRNVVEGCAFNVEPPWLHAFEAAFPYQETPDQERVIAEIKRDMAMTRPMDRLVCGDAGYGKTELAMRAAFIAVMNGRQVAVLVPTTVLAEQHFETFSDRMSAYPVRIEVVSRFQSYARRKRHLEEAAEGKIDILIGTHALLAKEVAFKNLGLLIIDEEQRFGVAHKERLKQARQIVDVLTLSATPIPRTLYMSMTGARDLSLLQTPPRERLAVETKVARDNDLTIRSAIRQELSRNGQVYFLYNRVMTIHLLQRRICALVPEARVAIAHGQMASGELAQVMRDFEAGAIDVLLCTTLVESGLDIPRANTILIHRADRFGIADLYQLRGRVGRSSQKGYAWLLLPEYGIVDEDARQRIAALQKHSGLGAGFNLALRDLEIRGAGNLLGAAQSGHIAAIGFGLYCQLLRRTIARMKGDAPPLLVDVDVALDFLDFSPGTVHDATSACLPYTYIEDEAHRMIVHRRMAEAVSLKEVRALKEELMDRYGRPPDAVIRLLRLTELRILAAQKQIGRVETRNGKIHLYPTQTRMPAHIKGHLPVLKGRTADAQLDCVLQTIRRFEPSTGGSEKK